MDSILNFQEPLNVSILDQALTALYSGAASPEIHNLLLAFQDHPESWTRVDAILEQAQNPNTKIFALKILDTCVKTRWKVLPPEQREGIKSFLVNLIIRLSSDAALMREHNAVLKRLNMSLVEILKQDWPHNWPNFIQDLIASGEASDSLRSNNMNILRLLSEEIFDYSGSELTQEKMRELKSSLNNEFSMIFQVCLSVLETSENPGLLTSTLETLLRFLTWIPIGYILETNLIEILVLKFFPFHLFQNIALQCLSEIASLQFKDHPKVGEYNQKFAQLFLTMIGSIGKFLTPEIDVANVYKTGNPAVQVFVRHLALFISTFCRLHLPLLENGDDNTRGALLQALAYLLRISQVDDVVIFKICLEYWVHLVTDLYNSSRMAVPQPLMLGRLQSQTRSPRMQMYGQLLSQLRLVLIARMAKPEEVLIVEDENGNIVRETMRDTDSITLYKNMRECLIFLTHLDPNDTQDQMLQKLSLLIDGTEYTWHNLNTVCWAIGSISGAMSEDQEKTFLVNVIKDLLGLCEMRRGKDHKAVIASNIMYVVGQYPRFLRNHWRFLKTVVNKLFEFMHEKHPGVQDMACDTFLKISKKCRRKFVVRQDDADPRPFIEDMLENLPATIQDLEPSQTHTFYEALGHIVQSQTDPQKRQALLFKLMELPNQSWTAIVTHANDQVSTLFDLKTVKSIVSILKTNNCVASAMGHGYIVQLGRIYLEMLQMYKVYSEFVSNEIATKGPGVTGTVLIRSMRSVKKEVIKLVETFVANAQPADQDAINKNFLPALLDPVLGDYSRNHPNARDAEVLSLFAAIITKLGGNITEAVPRIFEAVFQCTLDMITQNFEDFPDHRIGFFKLIEAINSKAFRAFFLISEEQFKLVIDSIVWAMKHLERNVAETGLNILYELLKNVEFSEISGHFYQKYFMSLLNDLFVVLTDTLHKPGFKMHATILAKLFNIVESGSVILPLWGDNPMQFPNNQAFLRQYVVNLIGSAFPNLSVHDVQRFVDGLFNLNNNVDAFKMHLRDFLMQLKEFSATSNADLYLEEKERQMSQLRAAEQERVQSVPGLQYFGPSSGLNGIRDDHDEDAFD